MRVLFATDGSEEAVLAMRSAGRLLASTNRQIDLLFVGSEPRAARFRKSNGEGYESRIALEGKRILADAKHLLAQDGIRAETHYRTGSPARLILKEAGKYDVTVIGAKDGYAHVGLGPVASRVAEHAVGCVLVGRELKQDQGIRVLVPVDGSDGSEQALDTLATFFDVGSAEVTLLHVLETPWLSVEKDEEEEETPLKTEPADLEISFQIEMRREGERLLAVARARLSEQHPGLTTLLREGNPANEILSEAEQGDYDLVVLGASGSTDLKHRILGSVSNKVAWNAPCSVLLVRIAE